MSPYYSRRKLYDLVKSDELESTTAVLIKSLIDKGEAKYVQLHLRGTGFYFENMIIVETELQ